MRERKWLALALAVILVVGLMGGVVSARNNGPAAPAVANKILKDAGIRGAGQIMRQVAHRMGNGAAFPDKYGDYVEKSDTEAYWDAVAWFLDSLDIEVDSTQRPVRHERPERPFSPKDIDDLFLWLDAGKGITKDADANVTRWADQSGYDIDNDAVAREGMEPTYYEDIWKGKPVVYFDGTSELIIPIKPDEDDFEDGITVFLVANFFEAGYALGSWDAPYFYMGIWEDDGDYWIDTGFGDNLDLSRDAVDLQGWRILEMINDGEDTVVYDDGEEVSVYPSSFIGNTEYELAIGNANGTDYYFNGDIAEILIYNRALGDEEREEIEDYLKDKYFD